MIKEGGEYGIIYRIVKSLYCTPETNRTLYVNYTSIINILKKRSKGRHDNNVASKREH